MRLRVGQRAIESKNMALAGVLTQPGPFQETPMGEKRTCVVAGRNANKPTTRRYWASNRYQRRREARIKKHILLHPNDLSAPTHLKRIEDEPVRHILRAADAVLPRRKQEEP